jgi:ParB-like chromosome segregation protein Spo0J
MDIRKVAIGSIKAAEYNPRRDLQPGDEQYELIKKGITEFGLVDPLIWNEKTGNLVGGHQRLKVLRELGHTEVDVSVVSLTLVKEKALNVALNKLSGEWDMPLLKDLLQEIDTGELDMELTGFTEEAIGALMSQFHVTEPEPQKEPELRSESFIEIYCTAEDLNIFKPTLEDWGKRVGVTVNISG